METENPEKAQTSTLPPPPAAAESPPLSPPLPSSSTSPSHEFSFTISFHAPNSLSNNTSAAAAAAAAVRLSKSPSTPLDFDFAPADDIFFHGHLLPLHFVSHRPSDVSLHNAGFLSLNHIETEENSNANISLAAAAAAVSASDYNDCSNPKSFSLYWLRKWLKGNYGEDGRDDEKQRRKSKKKVFRVARLWKKYSSLMEHFFFFKEWKEKKEIRRSQLAFSGNSWRRRWRGEFSAPASIRTSPANSGLLVPPTATNFSSQESTLEELQNAVQAAIAHCKDSIAVKEYKC